MRDMTREHPRWTEFLKRLEGPEGCNFRLEDENDPASVRWNCGKKLDGSKHILADMGETPDEIDTSLEYFADLHGFCDCEILFNVAKGADYAEMVSA